MKNINRLTGAIGRVPGSSNTNASGIVSDAIMGMRQGISHPVSIIDGQVSAIKVTGSEEVSTGAPVPTSADTFM